MAPEADPSRLPPWLRTWWGRLVSIVGGLAVVVGAVAAAFQIADYVGWYQRPDSVAGTEPLEAQQESPEQPGNSYSGGWGPERDTFTMGMPADYAVLNSITDNPHMGDERNFFRVRLDEEGTFYRDDLDVKPGDVVMVAVWFRNAAADNLAGSAATIHGLTAELYLPSPAQDLPLGVTLSAKNAMTVWDGARLHAAVPVTVQFVNGSAEFQSNAATYALDDSFGVGEPALIGIKAGDGEFTTGDGLDNGWLTYEMVVVAAE